MSAQWDCILKSYEFPKWATRQERRVLRLLQDARVLEEAVQNAVGVSERIEFVTRKTTAIALRILAGTRTRNEDRGNHVDKLCRSLSNEHRQRLRVLGQAFDGTYRVLIGRRTEAD